MEKSFFDRGDLETSIVLCKVFLSIIISQLIQMIHRLTQSGQYFRQATLIHLHRRVLSRDSLTRYTSVLENEKVEFSQ
jgi:hypothetical protein